MAEYKRGTIVKNGKKYGFYPDGSLYRIYESNLPFLSVFDRDGEPVLRIRQATEKGYVDCPLWGVCDVSYPSSTIRRSRVVDGGLISNTITCETQLSVFIEL